MYERLTIAGIFALLASYIATLNWLFLLLAVSMTLNMIGSLAVAVKQKSWRYTQVVTQVWKKVGVCLAVAGATLAEALILFANEYYAILELADGWNPHFTATVTIWLTLNELYAVLQNAVHLGVVLPDSITARLPGLKKILEGKARKR